MFKKLFAASAMLAFMACSSDSDGGGETGTSSSGGSDVSSSSESISENKETKRIVSGTTSGSAGESATFSTHPYAYTVGEELTDFWDMTNSACKNGEQDDDFCQKGPLSTSASLCAGTDDVSAATCEVNKQNAILQNDLTIKYSPLHYNVNPLCNQCSYIHLYQYNLTEVEHQAGIGINVNEEGSSKNNVAEILSGLVAFSYTYMGPPHELRLGTANDEDFWVHNVEANNTNASVNIEIPIEEFFPTASLGEDTAVDISQITRFLFVVPFDEENNDNNTGTLRVYRLEAILEK